MYVNKDHANSKGLTLALSKRSSQKFSGNLDYTFSVSEGNASDPTAAFYDEQSDIEPEKMLILLIGTRGIPLMVPLPTTFQNHQVPALF